MLLHQDYPSSGNILARINSTCRSVCVRTNQPTNKSAWPAAEWCTNVAQEFCSQLVIDWPLPWRLMLLPRLGLDPKYSFIHNSIRTSAILEWNGRECGEWDRRRQWRHHHDQGTSTIHPSMLVYNWTALCKQWIGPVLLGQSSSPQHPQHDHQ